MPVHAPELAIPGPLWLNTPAPIPLSALRGRIVILDFWALCCVNCIQLLPTLARVEETFPNEVAVIGVHSPKFPHEREPDAVRAAIARYGIRHPVIHDPEMLLWQQYAVRAWPTLVFLDPGGLVLGQMSGEPDPDQFADVIGRMVEQARRMEVLRPIEPHIPPAPPLTERGGRFRFPGKLRPIPGRRADAACWVLADGGHHQIVLLDDAGAEVARFGSGKSGFADGDPHRAAFRAPQGVSADAETLWVADTGNHAIRRIDLATGAVATLAGTGRRGRALGQAATARTAALASPWDIVPFGGGAIFANAGTHQLGALDPAAGEVERVAGTGGENIQDGPADQALLAQPSGLALANGAVFFADAEASAVRWLDLATMQVQTLVGTGLFDFGYADGDFAEARLQHPLGLDALPDGTLLVADSYNNTVRVLDPVSRTVRTLDDGFVCRDRLCLPPGGEPAGVAADPRAPADDPRILLVETNRHRIMEIRPARREYRTWAG